MNWQQLTSDAQLNECIQQSNEKAIVIFKHSTACPISAVAKSRFELAHQNGDTEDQIVFVLLDLLAHRALSNKIAADFGVHHESPQLLLIHHGKCLYHASHNSISYEQVIKRCQKLETP